MKNLLKSNRFAVFIILTFLIYVMSNGEWCIPIFAWIYPILHITFGFAILGVPPFMNLAACGETGGYVWAWKKPSFPCRKAGLSSRAICDFRGLFKGRRCTVCPHFPVFRRIKAHPLVVNS